jgi:hypothetical protein
MQQLMLKTETLTEAGFRAFDTGNQAVLHSSYSQHIVRIKRQLPNDALKLMAYDDIKLRPDLLLKEIESFLGLSHHSYLPGKVKRQINASENLSTPACLYKTFSAAINKELEALAGLGFEIPKSWLEPQAR